MLNKIMLIGNLGRDPEMSFTPAGQAVTKFSLAVSRRWNEKATGERKEEAQWFNCVAWEKLAETCNQYLRKGSKVYVEGRMTSRKYTDKQNLSAPRGIAYSRRWRCSTPRRPAQTAALVAPLATSSATSPRTTSRSRAC